MLGKTRSPAVARTLEIDWKPAEWPTTWDEKYGERSLPIGSLLKLDDRKHYPAIVYIHEVVEAEKQEELEADMFGDSDLILATRFFRCFSINIDDIQDKKLRERYAKKLPALIFVDGRGEETAIMQGRIKPARMKSAMKKVFGDHFKGSMPKLMAAMNDLLDDLERAEDRMVDARKMLDETEDRMADRDGATADKKVEKKREDYEEARAEFDKVNDKLKELARPPLKVEEATTKN